MTSRPLTEIDPFDLPEWLGDGSVTWESGGGVRVGHLVTGELVADREGAGHLPCDLLAVDEAHPEPVASDAVRTRTHLAWRHGQVLLLDLDGRLTLAVPGVAFTADLVLESLARLAKAVGAMPEEYAARLRIGSERRR